MRFVRFVSRSINRVFFLGYCWMFKEMKSLVLFAVFSMHLAIGLDRSEVFGTQNEDCLPYVDHRNHTVDNVECDGNASKLVGLNDGKELLCPPWYYRDPVKGTCIAGKDFSSILFFQVRTDQTYLQTLYCMTTSNESGTDRRDVIGNCLFSFDNYIQSTYYPLPCNISRLNEYTCAGLNREGQLCGRCEKGFAPPVFSYSLSCVNCTDYHLNWLKYIGVAFGPLTIFCLLICFFHISAMSPYLFGFVFICQILSMPIVVRVLHNSNGYREAKEITKLGENLYISFFSIWNLDIFRPFNKPFCLHPKMTIVQALALDYVIALYPLALLVTAYVLVSLYSRNSKVVVALWRPFGAILRPCVRNLDIQTSLVESFATLFFLSAMKVQSVCLDLLSPTVLYYPNGTTSNKLYLFLAGNVEYFGGHHLPYGLLAIFLLVMFTLLPGLLFLLYPCRSFQRLLNRANCNSIMLKTFMDVFQGNYKDGTNNTKDYRFFSGIFFLSRFVLMAVFALLNSLYSFLIFGTILTMLGFSVATLHPQRTKLHYALDCITLMLVPVFMFPLIGLFLAPHNSIASQVSRYYGAISLLLPIMYIICLVSYWVIARKRIPQRLGRYIVTTITSVVCINSSTELAHLMGNQ